MTTINNNYSNNTLSNSQASSSSPAEQKEANNLFEEITGWADAHSNNMKETAEGYYEAANKLSMAGEILKTIEDPEKKAKLVAEYEKLLEEQENCAHKLEEEYQKNQEEIGLDFDFMQGKDAKNEEEYNAQLAILAEGEFNSHKISNDDKEITREEYIKSELQGQEFKTLEEQQEAVAYSYALFDIIDKKMGNSDSNETLSKKELESFYKNLDEYQGLDEEGNMVFAESDGVISFEGASGFAVDVVDSIIEDMDKQKNSKEINDLVTEIFQ